MEFKLFNAEKHFIMLPVWIIIYIGLLASPCVTQSSPSGSESSSGALQLPCSFRGTLILHGDTLQLDECTTCGCDNTTVKCDVATCSPTFCDEPIQFEGECCNLCPYYVPIYEIQIYTQDVRGSIIYDLYLNLNIKINQDGTGVEGEGLWKLGMWASGENDGSGERVGYQEQVLTPGQAGTLLQRPLRPGGFEFNIRNIVFSLDSTGITCPQMTNLCVEFAKGDAPDPVYPHLPFDVVGVASVMDDTQDPSKLITCQPFSTCEVPTIHYGPQSQSAIIGGTAELTCSIDNAIVVDWLKLSTREQTVIVGEGNAIRLTNLEPSDQGVFICRGRGGGEYEDVTVETDPAVLILEGVSTFVASIGFPELEFTSEPDLEEEFVLSLQNWFEETLENAGEFPESSGDYSSGDYSSGDYSSGDYSSGDYSSGDYSSGDYSSGDYSSGDYSSDSTFHDRSSPRKRQALPDGFSDELDIDFYGARALRFVVQKGSKSLTSETLLYTSTSVTKLDIVDAIEDELTSMQYLQTGGIYLLGYGDPYSVQVHNAARCPAVETLVPYQLTWPAARIGETIESLERCPGYLNKAIVNPGPRATRQCKGDLVSRSMWQQVIVSDCLDDEEIKEVNNKLVILSETDVTMENVAEVAFDLSQVTNDSHGINATGLVAIALNLERIVDVELPIPSALVTDSVIETVDNILNIDNEEFIEAVDSKAPARILRSLEEQISSIQTQGDNFTANGDNIDVYAVQIPQTSFDDGLGFASVPNDVSRDTQLFNDPGDIPVGETEAAIVLPVEVAARFRDAVNDSAVVPVSFVLYQNSNLFQSKLLREKSATDVTRQVGSRVISATIEGLKITNLAEPVVLTFQTTKPTNENNTITNVQCVFWDFELNAGNGDWSTDGCKITDTTDSERTICECDHLTSFAVLIDVHGQKFASLALDIISQIGCGISITALIITLITYLSAKSLRSKTPKKILICLSFTLLCLYFVFVVGVDQNNSSSGCVAVAVLLHYLTLATVAWMGIEAINLYLLIVKVFNADVSHFMRKACLLAWGGPLIPVILVLAIDISQYHNDHHCFMQPSYAFYFADLLLIFLILTCNLVIFVMLTYKLTCGRKNVGRSSDGDNKQTIIRAVNAIAISILLGLTWIFGFLTIIENRQSSLAFQVLFCLFNSLQGLFIFLLFCVRSQEVRNVWKRWYTFGTFAGTSDFSTSGKSTVGRGTRPKSKSSVATASTSKGESVELTSISK